MFHRILREKLHKEINRELTDYIDQIIYVEKLPTIEFRDDHPPVDPDYPRWGLVDIILDLIESETEKDSQKFYLDRDLFLAHIDNADKISGCVPHDVPEQVECINDCHGSWKFNTGNNNWVTIESSLIPSL